MRLAVLLSGSGRTLENLLRRVRGAEFRVVVSSKPGVRGVEVARRAGIPVVVLDRRNFRDDAAFSDAVTDAIRPFEPDLVLMAGFLHRWLFPPEFEGRVLNIHPSLLPRHGGRGMYGERVHRAVLAAGDRESGCTVHIADHEYDHGPIVVQRRVPVLPGDTPETLAARVFEQECEAYPEAIRILAERLARNRS